MAKEVNLDSLTEEERQERADVIRELKRYRRELSEGRRTFLNGPAPVKDLIKDWRKLRPKMVKHLRKLGILEDYALVCLERRDDRRMQLQQAGWDRADANVEASQYLLLWDEGDEKTPEEQEKEDNEATAFMLLLNGPMTESKKREWERLTGRKW